MFRRVWARPEPPWAAAPRRRFRPPTSGRGPRLRRRDGRARARLEDRGVAWGRFRGLPHTHTRARPPPSPPRAPRAAPAGPRRTTARPRVARRVEPQDRSARRRGPASGASPAPLRPHPRAGAGRRTGGRQRVFRLGRFFLAGRSLRGGRGATGHAGGVGS